MSFIGPASFNPLDSHSWSNNDGRQVCVILQGLGASPGVMVHMPWRLCLGEDVIL